MQFCPAEILSSGRRLNRVNPIHIPNQMFRFPILLSLVIFLSAFPGIAVRALAQWTWNDPLPQGNAILSLAASRNATLVGVGDLGAVVRKSSGGPWESVGSFAPGKTLSAVRFFDSSFYALGSEAGLWRSTDGSAWSLVDSNIRGRFLLSTQGRLLCLGSQSLWVSTNGFSFQSGNLSQLGLESFRSAAASGGKFLVLRRNRALASSPDGLVWSPVEPVPGGIFFTISGGPAGFLAGGFKPSGSTYATALYRSSDAVSWTEIPLPENSNYLYKLMETAQGWILDELVDSGGLIFRRGVMHRFQNNSWQTLASAPPAFIPYASLPIDATETLLAGDRGAIFSLLGNGTFSSRISSAISSEILDPARFAAAASSGIALAIDRNVNRPDRARYYSSTSGAPWSQTDPAPLSAISALGLHQGSLVAYSVFNPVNTRGFHRLVEGSWTALAPDEDSGLDAISLDASVVSFAANGDASAVVALTRQETFGQSGSYSAIRGVYVGSNWQGWTPVSLPEARLAQPPAESVLESVHWDGTRFVLHLHPGRIFTSPDGQSWNLLPPLPSDTKETLAADYPGQAIPAANVAVSVVSDGTRLVARAAKAAANGIPLANLPATRETFFVFEHGRWWPLKVSEPVSVDRRRVFHDGSRFLAIGDGIILDSPYGFTWSSRSIPASASFLLPSPSRLIAFTDSFGILSHEGPLGEGTSLNLPALSPLVQTLEATGSSYTLRLDLPQQQAWSISGIPNWLTVSPSSGTGPASITISTLPNAGKSPRGAILRIGGLTHLVGQRAAVPPATFQVGPSATSVSIPFAGPSSAAASTALAAFPKASLNGSGTVRVSLPANTTPAERQVVINLNGIDHTIRQAGTPPAVLRAGQYSGLLGTRFEGAPVTSLEALEAYEGSLAITLAPPSASAPHGAYSATLSILRGNRTLQFKSRGTVNLDATISGNWTSSGKNPLAASVSLAIRDDLAFDKTISGTLSLSGVETSFAVFAGKQVFHPRSNPLPADIHGKATFFLATFDGNFGASADTAVGTATLSPAGALRLAATSSDGSKISASSPVWGAAGPSLAIPLHIPLAKGTALLAGHLSYDATLASSDWSGPLNSITQAKTVQLSGALSRYTPPARGASLLPWSSPVPFIFASEELNLVTGNATFKPPGTLSFAFPNPSASASLKVNPASGLATGKFSLKTPGFRPIPLLGAVNPKTESFDGFRGTIIGLVPKKPGGTFTIAPE
jgi:hypothetical protein